MVDINEFIKLTRQLGPDLMKNYCFINGNLLPLEQIESMSLEEYSARTIFSLPLRFYKYFPDVDSEELGSDGSKEIVNYSAMALESNEVFLSSPSKFDDPFDSEINVPWDDFFAFRVRTYARWTGCNLSDDMPVELIANNLTQRLSDAYQKNGNIRCAFEMDGQGEPAKQRVTILILKLELELTKNHTTINLGDIIAQEYRNFVKELQDQFRISCFTTTPYSQLMWGGSYADEHRGFCLEYTVNQDQAYQEILHNIRPVIYCKTRRPVTQAILDAYDNNWSIPALRDVYVNGVLRKSFDWAYQNEWRLMLPPRENAQKGYCVKFFPLSRVFLGNRMPAKRRHEIIEICKRKGIPYVGVTRSPERFEMQECNVLCENCPQYRIEE